MIRLLSARPEVEHIRVFHPSAAKLSAATFGNAKSKLDTTSDLDDLVGFDGAVVASPNETHFSYIQTLLERVGYVLCEKPPATTHDELATLGAFDAERRGRILFNFNYARTRLVEHVRVRLIDKALGDFVHASFIATHGLAFNKSFASNWRAHEASPFSSILGNLGIHYVHLALDLFGEAAIGYAASAAISGHPDTASFTLQVAGGRTVSVALSYAAPYINRGTVIFTDGYIALDDGEVSECRPRDTFDAEGRFCAPPRAVMHKSASAKAYYDDGMAGVIDTFLSAVGSGGHFDERSYGLALRSAALLLDLHDTAFSSATTKPH